MKLLFAILCLLIISKSYALDINSKFMNSDKSSFETISDSETIESNRMMFFLSNSIVTNPLVNYETEEILINDLVESSFSLIYGVTDNFELGLTSSFYQTKVPENSLFNEYQGLSDLAIELKYNVIKNLAIIPVYIQNLNNQEATSGSFEGGYGLRIVGSLFEKSALPIYYSLGQLQLKNTKFNQFNQEVRHQYSLGTIIDLKHNLDLGFELYQDYSNEFHKPIELLTHFTYKNKYFNVRTGFGNGFLNEANQNEFRYFINLFFDYSFDDQIAKKLEILNNRTLIRELNSVDEEKMKVMMAKTETIKNEKDEDVTVLPFYSVKEIKKNKPQQNPLEEKIKYIESKKERLNKAYNKMQYFYNADNLKAKDQIRELSWSLRVVEKRKNTMRRLKKEYENVINEDKLFNYQNNELEKKVVAKLDQLKKKTENSKKKSFDTIPQHIIDEQKKAYEISKTKTLQDLIKERKLKKLKVKKKLKPKKVAVQEKLQKIKENKIEKIVHKNLKIETIRNNEIDKFKLVNNKKDEVKSLKSKIDTFLSKNLVIKSESMGKYSNFYKSYKSKLDEKKREQEVANQQKVIEAFKEIDKSKDVKIEEKSPVIELNNLKELSIQEKYEQWKTKQKEEKYKNLNLQKNDYEMPKTNVIIYEEDEMEESLGPRY